MEGFRFLDHDLLVNKYLWKKKQVLMNQSHIKNQNF